MRSELTEKRAVPDDSFVLYPMVVVFEEPRVIISMKMG
jgi:hypothetical protein